MTYTLAEINNLTQQQFVDVFGGIFESSPWIAKRAFAYRPFSSIESIGHTMKGILMHAEKFEQHLVLLAHPNLGSRITMSHDSLQEQQQAGLQQLSKKDETLLKQLNDLYCQKFGFPFIIAVRAQQPRDILHALYKRLSSSREVEWETALEEVLKIADFRLRDVLPHEEESTCL